MKGKITPLGFAIAVVLLFGCTMQVQSPEELINANGTAQAFMAAHPNAQVSYTYISMAAFGNVSAQIASDCKGVVAPGEFYKADIYDMATGQRLVMWLDWEKRAMHCLTEKRDKGITPSAKCEPGWKCIDGTHRAYRNEDCSWKYETFCEFGCDKGDCAKDTCAKVTCADYCVGKTLFSNGKCAEGACTYERTECEGICEGAQCTEDKCIGVSCDDKCDGSVRKYGGECASRVCSYSDEKCELGCYMGRCLQKGTMFVTSQEWNGNLGGISGADAKCQAAASAAKLQGKWRALVSDKDHSAKSWLPDSAYTKLDGTMVAKNRADLLDGTILSPINIDEFGKAASGFRVWTGTSITGTPYDGPLSGYCDNWVSWNVNKVGGVGNKNSTDSGWINYGAELCERTGNLYCMLFS
ncbi:MAG: DUF1554 domain-containing protein [Candidatus Diapherotrites archaeon]